MASLVIPPGYANVLIRWTLEGDNEEMMSGIGVRLQAGVSDPTVIAGNVLGDWLSNFPASSYSGALNLHGATAYVGSDGDYPSGEYVVDDAGTAGFTVLPNNCAILVRKLTGLGGRRNRGRMFIPAAYCSEANVDHNGDYTSGCLADLQTQFDGFFSDIEANATAYDAAVLFHSAAPTTPTLLTGFSVQTKIGTQRKRMRR